MTAKEKLREQVEAFSEQEAETLRLLEFVELGVPTPVGAMKATSSAFPHRPLTRSSTS